MNPTFTETQQFNKWWSYLLFVLPFMSLIIPFVLVQFDIIEPKGKEKAPISIILGVIPATLFFIWGITMKLKTTIDENGINVNFFGIPFCKKHFTWDDIKSISVVQYSPLSDYGGWGVRYSLTGNDWCYNVPGNYGIKLFNKNDKPFLIGTQQKEEAEKIINHYFKKQ